MKAFCLVSPTDTPQLKAVMAFLAWQKIPYTVCIDSVKTLGVGPTVALLRGKEVMAHGYWSIVRHLSEQGFAQL